MGDREYTFNPNLRAMTAGERASGLVGIIDTTNGQWRVAAEVLRIASALHPTPDHAEFAEELADLADGLATWLEDEDDGQFPYLRALALMTDTEMANLLAAVAATKEQ